MKKYLILTVIGLVAFAISANAQTTERIPAKGLAVFAHMPSIGFDKFIWQGNRKIFGSQIGGIKETQEMLDYSVKNNIYPEVELINAEGKLLDEAYQNVLDGKVKFRYVIDMTTLK